MDQGKIIESAEWKSNLRQIHVPTTFTRREAVGQPSKHIHGIRREAGPIKVFVARILQQIEIVKAGSGVQGDDGSVARVVLECTHAGRVPDRLLGPFDGMCLPRFGHMCLWDNGAVILGLQLEDEFPDVLGDVFDGAHDGSMAQWTCRAHVDEVVGHAFGCDAQVGRRGLRLPLLLQVDSVRTDDGEARREPEVEPRRTDDGVYLDMGTCCGLQASFGKGIDLSPDDFDFGRA